MLLGRRSWSNTVYRGMAREWLRVDWFCERRFWKVFIISFNSIRRLKLLIFGLQSIPLFKYNCRPHELFLSITCRYWQSIPLISLTILFSNTRLVDLKSHLVYRQRHIVVLNSLRKIGPLVFTGASRISGIDVVGIDVEHSGEVINSLFNLTYFLKSAPSYVKGSCVARVDGPFILIGRSENKFHKGVWVFNRFLKVAIFKVIAGS